MHMINAFCHFYFILESMAASRVQSSLSSFWNSICRKKTLTDDFQDTPLKKCLSTFDMTLLGVGQMVGAGIYVLTGIVGQV